VALALFTKVIIVSFIIWLLVILTTGYVSLGSILAALSVPVIALIFGVLPVYYIFILPAVAMIVIRHLPNIRRLQKGAEPRVRIW
jgi:glycerol-3-phosphate acyltransferase PlsY